MREKNQFYSLEKLEQITAELNKLPDLSTQRLVKDEALSMLKDTILTLKKDKGYTITELLEKLKELGMSDLTQKDIKLLFETKKKTRQNRPNSNQTNSPTNQ
ncbi:mobilization protein MobC [Photorhabdus hainanensis]|uniref:mobilization protein MobC n=1 Tax=Photorhabdus hainanensis TaxID=1004166 RepID=UPI001BD43E9D|nr:mobilization protein MobC [Photorhabdus hainanensis]MBS9434869.1 mobilization protein MobC [Photorhabdus hainanensis]